MTPAARRSSRTYQARAKAEGVDPLGYYLGGWGYAYLQVLGKAVEGAKSINDDKLADYLRTHTSSRPSWATSSSARTASGPSPACCRCSITTSPKPRTSRPWRGMDYQTSCAAKPTGDDLP